jgi:hypothetical protein
VNFLLTLHGELRWIVALVGLVTIVRCTVGWQRGADFKRIDRILMAAFTGLFDLNLLFGIILLFGLPGGLSAHRIEHATTMLLALIVAHSSLLWRKSDDAAKKFRGNLIAVTVALILVFVAVIRLRSGWIF